MIKQILEIYLVDSFFKGKERVQHFASILADII